MNRSIVCAMLLLGFLSLSMQPSLAAEDNSKEAEESQKVTGKESEAHKKDESEQSRETFTVSSGPLKIEESLDGRFVATERAEISLWPESWSDFKIKDVVEHGAEVQKGETLFQFEDKDLNKAIADLDLELHLGELKINRMEQALPRQERSLKRTLANAEEALKRAKEDYERYQETEREQAIDSANMNLKMAKFNLDYYKDELEQLEKMYEADDLTEETEEIVLRRQKFMVEYGEFNYELSKHYHDRTLNVSIPRSDRDMKESLDQAEDRVESAELANQIDLSTARYELEKLKSARKDSLDKHVKLLADRDLMTITSPITGVVYYGDASDGKWSKIATQKQKLLPGKSADKQAVLITVLDKTKLQVVSPLDEKLRISLKPGEKVEVQPTPEGSKALTGKVASISAMPVADGKFEALFELTTNDLPEWLVPGMSCEVEVITYQKEDALLVPKKAIHDDESKDKKYVWTVEEDKPVKTWVETGREKGDKVEITSGLSTGDVVSLDDEKQEE